MRLRLNTSLVLPVTHKLIGILWATAMVTLPVTSFRYYPFVGETTYVRPLALYPVAIIIVILVGQWLLGRRRVRIPGTALVLGLLVLVFLASSVLGALHDPIPLRGQGYLGRALRAWSTLIIGLMFFVCAVAVTRTAEDIRYTVRWVLIGLCVTLVWSGLQAVTFYTSLLDKEAVTHWQLAFSMRELVRTNRISGLAYEPAWLAAQIATIYAPILLGAVLAGVSVTRAPWFEQLLLGLAFIVALATYSRGGILITLFSTVLAVALFGRARLHSMGSWFSRGFRAGAREVVLRLLTAASLLAVLVGVLVFLGQKNYFRRLWEISADTVGEYIIDINAGARSAYAVAAMEAYYRFPLTGVGLGASGFYIYDNLPDWSLTTVPEIARQLSPANQLFPNPKNLYVRLLAEAGLPAFILFIVFQFSVLGDSLSLLRQRGAIRLLAVAGVAAWVAIALQNITQDSFASPNLWLVPGMVAGAGFRWQELPT